MYNSNSGIYFIISFVNVSLQHKLELDMASSIWYTK